MTGCSFLFALASLCPVGLHDDPQFWDRAGPIAEPLPPAVLVSFDPGQTGNDPGQNAADTRPLRLSAGIPAPPPWLQSLIQGRAGQYGWGAGDVAAWSEIIFRESSYQPEAQNPTSTAYGLGQFLNTTWATVGCTKTADAGIQIGCMAAYISQRYGNPTSALAFWYRNKWY